MWELQYAKFSVKFVFKHYCKVKFEWIGTILSSFVQWPLIQAKQTLFWFTAEVCVTPHMAYADRTVSAKEPVCVC